MMTNERRIGYLYLAIVLSLVVSLGVVALFMVALNQRLQLDRFYLGKAIFCNPYTMWLGGAILAFVIPYVNRKAGKPTRVISWGGSTSPSSPY